MLVDVDGAPEIDFAGAAEVLRWYQFFVAAKVIRALMSRSRGDHSLVETAGDDNPFAETFGEDEHDFDTAPDYEQEHGNGSAKIALIAMHRALSASLPLVSCL